MKWAQPIDWNQAAYRPGDSACDCHGAPADYGCDRRSRRQEGTERPVANRAGEDPALPASRERRRRGLSGAVEPHSGERERGRRRLARAQHDQADAGASMFGPVFDPECVPDLDEVASSCSGELARPVLLADGGCGSAVGKAHPASGTKSMATCDIPTTGDFPSLRQRLEDRAGPHAASPSCRSGKVDASAKVGGDVAFQLEMLLGQVPLDMASAKPSDHACDVIERPETTTILYRNDAYNFESDVVGRCSDTPEGYDTVEADETPRMKEAGYGGDGIWGGAHACNVWHPYFAMFFPSYREHFERSMGRGNVDWIFVEVANPAESVRRREKEIGLSDDVSTWVDDFWANRLDISEGGSPAIYVALGARHFAAYEYTINDSDSAVTVRYWVGVINHFSYFADPRASPEDADGYLNWTVLGDWGDENRWSAWTYFRDAAAIGFLNCVGGVRAKVRWSKHDTSRPDVGYHGNMRHYTAYDMGWNYLTEQAGGWANIPPWMGYYPDESPGWGQTTRGDAISYLGNMVRAEVYFDLGQPMSEIADRYSHIAGLVAKGWTCCFGDVASTQLKTQVFLRGDDENKNPQHVYSARNFTYRSLVPFDDFLRKTRERFDGKDGRSVRVHNFLDVLLAMRDIK